MRSLFTFVCIVLFKLSFSQTVSVNYFSTVPKIHIRALEVMSDSKVWFAANRGVWGYTEDAGKTWHIDSLKVDTIYPHFRSIAVLNDSTVLLLGIASPAYLLKTTNKGKTWKVVYKNTHPKIFFDSMHFSDNKTGISIGDPIDSCAQIITTANGGESWQQIPCSLIPKSLEGEGCFAASNSNIKYLNGHIWFVSGGKHSRVFHSPKNGKHFEVYNTPIAQGNIMTGIFSFDILNEKTIVIAGGNYDKTDSSLISLAITQNGGKTWKPIKPINPFFVSCVQFKNTKEVFATGHDGTYRYNMTTEKTEEIKDEKGQTLKFSTLRFSPSKKTMWMAGANGKIVSVKLH